MKKLIPQSLKNIYHLLQAVFANVWFGFPSRKLKIIGVTGTNGKTTTVQMIARILEEANFKVAVASTINFKITDKEWVNKSKFTTLSSWALQKFLREAAAAGCEYAVLEVSSHALDQNRVWGVKFDVAVITNITREHLDYHETMEEYARAKEKLFAGLGKSGEKGGSVSVINLNTDFADVFLKHGASQKFGYFLESQNPNCVLDSGIQLEVARDLKLSISGSKFLINGEKFELNMPGEFNVENALAATCVGLSQDIPIEKISVALGKIKSVPGRMERIENNRGIEIIVDYAVTPDSLEKLYGFIAKRSDRATKEESGRTSKIIAVFGSCGERDRGKRPIMGEIVAKHADFAIVTNEDPYGEDPVQIINEVFSGVVEEKITSPISNFKFQISNFKSISNDKISKSKIEGVDAFRILDRREAIKKALALAKPGDIVVVTGKGAEEMMAIGSERIPWNDPTVIREILREAGRG